MRSVLVLVMLLVSVAGLSQTHYEGRISIGGKGGMTLSRVNFNPSVQQSMSAGFTAGAMFRYIEEKHFGLVAELNVSQRGWKESFDESDYRYSHRLTYLELPVMTHIYFGNERAKGFFNLGPEVNLMLGDGVSSNFDYQGAAGLDYFEQNSRHIEQYTLDINRKVDYGICAGAGMEFSLSGKQSLLLEGRFYYGLTDVFPNHKTDVFSGSNSMTIGVTLGYFYRIK